VWVHWGGFFFFVLFFFFVGGPVFLLLCVFVFGVGGCVVVCVLWLGFFFSVLWHLVLWVGVGFLCGACGTRGVAFGVVCFCGGGALLCVMAVLCGGVVGVLGGGVCVFVGGPVFRVGVRFEVFFWVFGFISWLVWSWGWCLWV